ncbi:MAG TPA: rod shape-determining protein MreC [Acidobacteriota bacterium]|nr:rod shape-determining protein MreC [Acidobacteriota bacterium]
MIGFILRHKTGLSFILIVAVLLSTIAAQVPAPRHPSVLAWAIYAVFSPLQQTVSYVIVGTRDVWSNYVDLRDVRKENETLRGEIAGLQRENQRLRETLAIVGGLQELDAFRKIFEDLSDRGSQMAMVIGAGVGDSSHTVLLNRGGLDGVTEYQGVICPRGVVGKVVRVGPTSCLVQLVTDPRFAMAARIQSSRVRGLIHGVGERTCELKFIRDNDQVAKGDRIVSSGLEDIFPNGILIGVVSSIQPGEPPFREVDVMPSVAFQSLEWVLIVERKPKPDASEEQIQ